MNDYEEMWNFDVVVDSTLKDINRIHPLKQQDTDVLFKHLQQDRNIRSIVIFGSALDMRCNGRSDLDVYVETDHPESRIELPYEELNTEIDLVRDLKHTSRLYQEIDRTGLEIYRRSDICVP